MMQLPSRNATRAPRVLLQHSFVATGRVGGRLAASAIQHCGCDVSFSSTVVLSRHPGLGSPIGGPREVAALAADADHAAPIDAVAIGYGGSKRMFAALADGAAEINAPVFVDPILGRRGRGLYVPRDAVEAARRLVARADVVTPNDLELEALTGQSTDGGDRLVDAAQALRKTLRETGPRLVVVKRVDESVRRAETFVVGDSVTRTETTLAPGRWRGTGDLFFGLFVGGVLRRATDPRPSDARDAAADAAAWIADALARHSGGGDAPLDAILDALDRARQRHRKIGTAPSP